MVKINDVIASCGHLDGPDFYLVETPRGLEFTRKNGTMGTAQWTICCADCFHDNRGDMSKITLKYDFVYRGGMFHAKR